MVLQDVRGRSIVQGSIIYSIVNAVPVPVPVPHELSKHTGLPAIEHQSPHTPGMLVRRCACSIPCHRLFSLQRNVHAPSNTQIPVLCSLTPVSSLLPLPTPSSSCSSSPPKNQPQHPPTDPPHQQPPHDDNARHLRDRDFVTLSCHARETARRAAQVGAHGGEDFIGVVQRALIARVVVDVQRDVFQRRSLRAERGEERVVLSVVRGRVST